MTVAAHPSLDASEALTAHLMTPAPEIHGRLDRVDIVEVRPTDTPTLATIALGAAR